MFTLDFSFFTDTAAGKMFVNQLYFVGEIKWKQKNQKWEKSGSVLM